MSTPQAASSRPVKPFSEAALDGAVELCRTLQRIPEDARMDALVLAVNYGCRTDWLTHEPESPMSVEEKETL